MCYPPSLHREGRFTRRRRQQTPEGGKKRGHMFILKLAGKILLLPVWLDPFVIGLAVKMTVQTYAVVRGILGFIFTLLIIATAYCYHDWVQVVFLFALSVILYLILFAGVFVDTVLDMTRERIIDFIIS